MKRNVLLLCLIAAVHCVRADSTKALLAEGWQQLVVDNDTAAIRIFGSALEQSRKENDQERIAESLLKLGIASYGTSFSNGLGYATAALKAYQKLETSNPEVASTGRSKCLQLISTIKSRQGKYRESVELSTQALQGFDGVKDTSGYPGLIYNLLGIDYAALQMKDSAAYFHRLALKERQLANDYTYLPSSYVNVAYLELENGNKALSKTYFDRALQIADSTGNRQSQVLALLGLGKWSAEADHDDATTFLLKARSIAAGLSDKSFYLRALQQLKEHFKKQGKPEEALAYDEEMLDVRDRLAEWEKEKVTRSLEVQFDVAEKDRQLMLIQKEKDIALLTNYLLWSAIAFLIIASLGIIMFLRRINKRNKLLIQTKEALVKAISEQKHLKEQQMQNEIEFRESQLNAVTLQMVQKNELMQELKEKLEQISGDQDQSLSRIINKGLVQDKEWSDFNASFESINKNFYARLKQAYPDISPNDLKICALIKMNLSIKEMAGILNISPDSVKTARYRLRKKLQLNTEDNLTDFILHLK